MAEFKSNYEKKKWDALASSSKGSIEKLKQGKASNSDLKNISSALSKYDELVQKVFDQAVDAMEEGAQRVLDKIREDREKKGKADLTSEQQQSLYEKAIERQLFEFGPDLVETIQTMLDKKFDALTEQTKRMSDYFKDVANFTEKNPGVSQSEMQNLLIDNYKSERGYEEARWNQRLNTLSHMIRDTVEDTFLDIFSRFTGKRLTPGPAGAEALEAVGHGYSPAQVVKLLDKEGYEGSTATSESTTASPTSLTPKDQEAIVTEGKKNNEDLVNKFKATFDDLLDDQDDKAAKRESKKPGEWWRSFKGWFGDKWTKTKKSYDEGWLGRIIKTASLALLAPQIFESMATKAKELFTWDNITKAGQWVMDQIVDKGPDVLKWVGDVAVAGAKQVWEWLTKGFNWVVDKIRSWLPKWAGGYSDEEKKQKAASLSAGPMGGPTPNTPAAAASLVTPAATNSSGGTETPVTAPPKDVSSTIANATPKPDSVTGTPAASGDSKDTSDIISNAINEGNTSNSVTAPVSLVGNTTNNTSSSTTVAPTSQRDTLTSSTAPSGTQTVSENTVQDKDAAVTSPAPAPTATGASERSKSSASAGKTGLGSFNISSATSDTLLLMNAGLIT